MAGRRGIEEQNKEAREKREKGMIGKGKGRKRAIFGHGHSSQMVHCSCYYLRYAHCE